MRFCSSSVCCHGCNAQFSLSLAALSQDGGGVAVDCDDDAVN